MCAFRRQKYLKTLGLKPFFTLTKKLPLFQKLYVTSDRAVYRNLLYYEHLSIAHCQVSLYANNYFEVPLKTVDTIGNCQRPVISLAVSQHINKIINQ